MDLENNTTHEYIATLTNNVNLYITIERDDNGNISTSCTTIAPIKNRSYYEKQREEFANRPECFGDGRSNKKMGDLYGYTLAPPMDVSDIEKYEDLYDLRIPESLRRYLLTISSETIGYYSYNLEKSFDSEPELIFIHETRDISAHDDKDVDIFVDDDKLDINKLHELGYYENYFIKTHENGCTYDDYLCVKGPKYGQCGSYKDGADFFSMDFNKIY